MSFILDALKKSESDRQRDSTAEFAAVPASKSDPRVPRWLWVVGILLAINLVVLTGLLLRPETPALPETRSTSVPAVTTAAATATPAFEAQVAEARQNPPARQEPAEPDRPVEPVSAGATAAVAGSPEPPRESFASAAALPTIHEVRAEGMVAIPDLHVDIHVYSERAEDRFVFINMTRHREGSQLSEGPVVEEITADGVVLSYQGRNFLLPRD